jgi:hypothetical protein
MIVGLFATTACATSSANLSPSTGPWQLLGTVFAMEGSVVGSPVPGAQLTMTSGGEIRGRATTDGSGRYAFDPLQAGNFVLTISAPGFVNLTPSVNLDRDMRADFAIKRP